MGLSQERLNLPSGKVDQPSRLHVKDSGLPYFGSESDASQEQTDGQQVDISAHSDRDLHVFFHHTPVKQMNRAVCVARIARIVGNHADGCTATMQFTQ
jgi:hypothetical protein